MGNLARLSEQSDARLEQLESDWLNGQIPDVASYFNQSACADPRAWRDLIELDMEYRWRRYQHGTSENNLDPFGFPQYPRLEHYTDLLDASLRPQLLNPELLAEEYRVRTFWGDRPDRGQFLDRLPEDSKSVEIALDLMDAELEIEGMSTGVVDRSSEETTQLFDLRSGDLTDTVHASVVPPRIGKYQLQELLGRGGFGEVWKAHDPDLNRPVALKFPNPKRELSEELYQRFRREAENMASLERVTGVVPVYEAGEHHGLPFIAASFIDGQDLSIRHKQNPLSHEESARIVADVAETLHRAHLKDLFHRDVKLSNILIDKDGQVFLSDFGLCVSEQEQLHEGHSATGTYAYMAPEQIHGNSHRVDGRADIYALGVVLYRLLTGRLPFIGNTAIEYMEQTLKKAPRPPRSIDDEIPEELERICLKCINKQVEDRYATAGDLARDLRGWISMESVPAVQSVPKSIQPTKSPRPFVVTLVLLMVAAAGLYGFRNRIGHSQVDRQGTGGLASNGGDRGIRNFDRAEADGAESAKQTRFDTSGLLDVLREKDLVLTDATPKALVEEVKSPQWEILSGGEAVRAKAQVDDSQFCLRSCGTIGEGETKEIQIELHEMPLGSSGGIFFGMSEPLFNSNYAHWKSIIIERQQDGTYWLVRRYDHFKNSIPYGSDAPRKNELKIEQEEPIRITLRIRISPQGLQEIEVNGQAYSRLAEHFREDFPVFAKQNADIPARNFHTTGRFGLTCRRNEVIFANPVIDRKDCMFKKLN